MSDFRMCELWHMAMDANMEWRVKNAAARNRAKRQPNVDAAELIRIKQERVFIQAEKEAIRARNIEVIQRAADRRLGKTTIEDFRERIQGMDTSAQALITKSSTEAEFYEILFSHVLRAYGYLKCCDDAGRSAYEKIENCQLAEKIAGTIGFHEAITATCAQLGIPIEAMAAYIGQDCERLKQEDFYIVNNVFKYIKEKNLKNDANA